MTKAEEKALEAYPIDMQPLRYQDYIDQFGGKTEIDVNSYSRRLFQEGYEQAEKDLGWHLASEHPLVDEEVIVLLGNYDDFPQIAIGHTVNPDSVVDIYGNPYKVIEYNGWNIPGVCWWMPMSKIPNEK